MYFFIINLVCLKSIVKLDYIFICRIFFNIIEYDAHIVLELSICLFLIFNIVLTNFRIKY